MVKAAEVATHVLKTILAFVMICLVLISCTNIFLRYVLEINWLAADEVQVFIMIGLTFLGAIVVSAEEGQLRLNLLDQLDAPRLKWLLRVIEAAVTAVVCGFVAYHSWSFLSRVLSMGQRGGSSGIPMWIPHSVVTICFVMLSLIAVVKLLIRLRSFVSKEDSSQ
jgi:TRAP-type C4-dicarboxylate transport system permease small subunit